ncbi:MAG TPA: aldo/keto reductase [Planctomycetaceae bacterium]|nr:aldo/keto reductase [Planctomycetaceae bacterium]
MSKPSARRSEGRLDRRGFLKSSVLAGTGAAVLSGAGAVLGAGSPSSAQQAATPIPVRPFGKTGWKLPILAMGGSAMVKRFITSYGVKLLSTEERVAMVRHAYDRGIRYFDTARVYGESESIIGKALKDVRSNIFLATKIYVTRPSDTRKCLETSLKELGTDHVETAQIHSPIIEAIGFKGAMKVHAELLKLRDEKMLRYIGLTTHVAFETVQRMITTGGFDQCLLAYGYFRKGMDTLLSNQNVELRELCLAKAHELGMGIVAMKVMGASVFGHNAKNVVADYDSKQRERLPGAAIRWVLQDPRVSLLNIGVSMPADVDANIAVLSADRRFTDEDRRLLADFSRRAYESEAFKAMRVV